MSLEQYVMIAELVASLGVIVSIVYLAVQVRQAARVNSANARHAISQFALDFTMFKAEHADRLERVLESAELGPGDATFRWWNHMMVFLHAETYYHHYELGLMPKRHWAGYVRYVRGYLSTPGVTEFWQDVGAAFSRDFASWVDDMMAEEGLMDSSGKQVGGGPGHAES
jgi:hypothetical protein